eukprot:TRINITY_DN43093_c0_g1_i1.p1 TRINITY_DN43093_c0_g1~~TRINITY_DN43093_c0_g1_i1.p1  ORF type:complete len:148 (+),score=36.09 TRINITY_DN43093_c0_g1_i1:85-528(+)
MAEDDFHKLFTDTGAKQSRRTVPMSGGNAEKNRANRQELTGSTAGRKFHSAADVDLGFFDDPTAVARDRPGAAGAAARTGERVITDNVDEVERQMWADAPQGDYQLEDAYDQAYKDMMRDGRSAIAHDVGGGKKQEDDDDEFDVYDK